MSTTSDRAACLSAVGPCPTVAQTLHAWAGRAVFFEPLQGNHGDTLIRLGSEHALREAGVRRVDSPEAAELIVINGGGGMADFWPEGFETLKRYQRFGDTPLIVLPSSIYFERTDFGALFAGRAAPTILYARELYSLERLRGVNFPVEVELRHGPDMAFHLAGTPFMETLRRQRSQRHLLVVERGDCESPTGARVQPMGPTVKRYIPAALKRPLKRQLVQRQASRSAFTQQALARLSEEHPDLRGLPVVSLDVSRSDLVTLREFGLLIARAAAVVSTRLHVCILASLLEKPTYVKHGRDAYRKLRGVYEYSLADQPHVRVF